VALARIILFLEMLKFSKVVFSKKKIIMKETEEYFGIFWNIPIFKKRKEASKLTNYSRFVLKLPIDSGISFSGLEVRT